MNRFLSPECMAYYEHCIDERRSKGDTQRVNYLTANVALDELRLAVQRAEEPEQSDYDRVADMLDDAVDVREKADHLLSLRARLLKAWIRPIVWADIINIASLGDAEAKRVAENIGLQSAAHATAAVAEEAIFRFDEIDKARKSGQDDAGNKARVANELVGLIGEASPILLGVRHTTAKLFAVPTTAFDDMINPYTSDRADGTVYDNRRNRTISKRSYQATSASNWHRATSLDVPIVDSKTLGNTRNSILWPKDNRIFVTARQLIRERFGVRLDPTTSSTIDRISSSVFSKILK